MANSAPHPEAHASPGAPIPLPGPEPTAPAAGQRRWILWSVAIGSVLSLVALGLFLYQRMNHVYVSDARIGSGMITISSRVPGWVLSYHVSTGDRVEPGDLLLVIDSRDANARLAELDARLLTIQTEIEGMSARVAMADATTQSGYEAQQAQLAGANAALAAAASGLDLARADFERAQSLLDSKIIAQQQWDMARAGWRKATEDHERARATVASARAALREAEAGRRQIQVLDREVVTLQHREEQVRAQRAGQQLSVLDHDVRSPIAGVVDRTFANDGEYVRPGQRLLMVHDPNEVWVDANVRETEIRRLRLGQRAWITVDAYPGERFEGVLTRIGSAATSEFALLPSPNPSGNFTKITQRLPVRIALEQREGKLRPGMMVEVDLEVGAP
jgi:membrane fusion protein (multidrug efflux system)